MKYLKVALVAVLSTLICLSFSTPFYAKGETAFRYAYAGDYDENADNLPYFCEEKSLNSALFAIPKTYCVEILKEDGEWYYCRYAKDEGAYRALRGYCLKRTLTPVESPFENEYLNYTFPVEFYAPQTNTQIDQFKVTLTVSFYGNGTMNASGMSYAFYDGKFGYVAGRITDYPKNDLPQPTLSTDIKQPENSVNATLITAAVITVVAVIAVAVLYFAGKRPKLPPKSEG
ncbi:MAG: hypothetical protein K2K38_06570 [Clostridia bacterium]|nr:hypothetical protein [Clostridia bacterium]